MADYTFSPAPVLVEGTGEFAIGATGVLRATTGGTPVPIYDLNNSLLTNITVGPKGAHQAFKADIPDGVLDFGSVLLPTQSLEAQRAGLDALVTADAALAESTAARTSAEQAAALVSDTVSGKANRLLTVKDIATNYQVVGSDAEEVLIRSTATVAITITFPSQATEPMGVGASGTILVDAAGQVTCQAGAGATLKSRGNAFKSTGDGAFLSWVKTSTNGFALTGDITT